MNPIFLKGAEINFILNSAIIGKTFSGCTCIAPEFQQQKNNQYQIVYYPQFMHFFSVIVQVVGVKNQVKKIVVVKDHPKIEAGMYYYD